MVFMASESCENMSTTSVEPDKTHVKDEEPAACEPSATESIASMPSVEVKPFFIFDFLEQVNEQDLHLAQKMLQTPQKRPKQKRDSLSSSSLAMLHLLQTSSFVTPPRKQQQQQQPKQPQPDKESCFRKRSVALGNGWNAKGLQKAKAGRWEEALVCWENSFEIRSQVLGESHLDVANTCNNIGIALGKLNRVDDALAALNRALNIRTDHFGLCSSEVAATLHNMGNVLQQAGKLEAALQYFCDTKKVQEQVYGPDHVQVARACVAMGHTYYQAMEYGDAREAYGDALAIFQRSGLDHSNPEVQNVVADLQELDKLLNDPCT